LGAKRRFITVAKVGPLLITAEPTPTPHETEEVEGMRATRVKLNNLHTMKRALFMFTMFFLPV